jgi:predicted permease
MGLFPNDVRTALRELRRGPGSTALSIASVALGIGLTTGIFSVADALLLRPLAVDRPAELLEVSSRGDDGEHVAYGWPDYEDMARASKGIAEVSAYTRRAAMLAGDEGSQMVLLYAVSPNHFSLLGVRAVLGSASLGTTAGRPEVVIGDRLWRRRFGGDPALIGKTIRLNTQAFTVAGVLPPEFSGLVRGVANDVWVSTDAWFGVLGQVSERQDRSGVFQMVARLRPGISREHAAAVFDAAIRGAGKHKPAAAGMAPTILIQRFATEWRKQLTMGGILALVLGLVLFVGCANAAQVRLAQAEERKRELAVRQALGAGTWRIARMLLVESALIAAAGAALGLELARFLISKVPDFFSVWFEELRIDHRVLAFTMAATLLSVALAGLAPVRHAVKLKLNEVLKSEQGVVGARREWTKRALVVGQIAISVVLFGLAVVFVSSARDAAAIRPGLDPAKKIFAIEPDPGWNWPRTSWCEQACARLAEVPGVRGVTYARRLPLSGSGGGMTARVEIPGQAPLGIHLNHVAGNYFSLVGTRVLAGRAIDTNDRGNSRPVVVVSRQLARQVFGERNAVGQWIRIDGTPREIVGVAEDGPSNYIHEEPAPYLYLPFAQASTGDITLLVETAGDPMALARPLLRALRRFDPAVSVFETTTLERTLTEARAMDRLAASAATALGTAALVLSAAGLFGIIQYAVNRRRKEIGLRMALGAGAREIRRMVLAEALRLAACGVPLGLALIAAAAHAVRSGLLGVSSVGPAVYVASAAAAAALALVAAWLPATRAARLDPMQALRE